MYVLDKLNLSEAQLQIPELERVILSGCSGEVAAAGTSGECNGPSWILPPVHSVDLTGQECFRLAQKFPQRKSISLALPHKQNSEKSFPIL